MRRTCVDAMKDDAPAHAVSRLRRQRVSHGAQLRVAVAAVAATLLTACAPHVRYVSTYCLTHDQQLPAEPPKVHSQLTGHADSDIGIIAGSAIRLRAWGEGLQTILEGCREPAK
jgi:ABC-type uncharacterized transport system auxiliary subunit